MEAAMSGNIITITVTYHLSTVGDADFIFVFHNGRIVEAETHSNLIAEGSIYEKICDSQSLDAAA